MGRLIDANKLIIHLADYQLSVAPYDGYSTEYHTIQNCIEAVQDQPTAYDMNKVVEELEAEKEILEKELEKCIFKALPYHDSIEGKIIGIKKAIDIVKRGGRE